MTQPIHNPVHINIDKKPKTSSSPTTGAALYALGEIVAGYDLFREIRGKGDDEPIANSQTSITLHEGDHFYSAQSTLNPGNRV